MEALREQIDNLNSKYNLEDETNFLKFSDSVRNPRTANHFADPEAAGGGCEPYEEEVDTDVLGIVQASLDLDVEKSSAAVRERRLRELEELTAGSDVVGIKENLPIVLGSSRSGLGSSSISSSTSTLTARSTGEAIDSKSTATVNVENSGVIPNVQVALSPSNASTSALGSRTLHTPNPPRTPRPFWVGMSGDQMFKEFEGIRYGGVDADDEQRSAVTSKMLMDRQEIGEAAAKEGPVYWKTKSLFNLPVIPRNRPRAGITATATAAETSQSRQNGSAPFVPPEVNRNVVTDPPNIASLISDDLTAPHVRDNRGLGESITVSSMSLVRISSRAPSVVSTTSSKPKAFGRGRPI